MQTRAQAASPPALLGAPIPKGEELFVRAKENPILSPTRLWWESMAVFNPGVVEDEAGVIHILYRALGRDAVSRLGYARSRDGVTLEYRSPEPVFEPDLDSEYEERGVEDPRITFLDGAYHMTYTGVSNYRLQEAHPEYVPSLNRPDRVRVSLAVTADFSTFRRYGVILSDMDNKDAVLFPEKIRGMYALLHRLPPDIWISYSDNMRDWKDHRTVLRTRPAYWDERRLGVGAPPLRTDAGWLVSYHGSDHHNVYRAGFILLDANDPSVVLGRSKIPVLEPRAEYEMGGKDVPNVVFPTGIVRRGDTLLLYYGGADRVVAVARGSLTAVLASLR